MQNTSLLLLQEEQPIGIGINPFAINPFAKTPPLVVDREDHLHEGATKKSIKFNLHKGTSTREDDQDKNIYYDHYLNYIVNCTSTTTSTRMNKMASTSRI